MSYSVFTLANLASVNVPPNQVVADFNGAISTIDLCTPMTFVDPKYKIVLSAQNNMDLIATIEYILYQVKNSQNTPVNQNDVDMAMPIIAARVSCYNMLCLFHAAGVNITIRGSDSITDVSWAAESANLHVSFDDTASQIYNFIDTNDSAKQAISTVSQFCSLCIVANWKHRDLDNGHNWMTSESGKKGTVAYNLIRMAGRRSTEFKRFMDIHGHDLFHFLSSNSIHAMADAITGATQVTIPQIGVNVGAGGAPVVAFPYMGQNVNGQMVHTILDVGDACRDRYVSGTVGISAIMTGLNYLEFTLTNMGLKVPGIDIDLLIRGTTWLASDMRTSAHNRDRILQLKDSLGFPIAFSVGFAMAFPEMEDDIRKHPSVVKYSENKITAKSAGMSLGKSVRDMKIDDRALKDMIGEVLNTISEKIKEVNISLGNTDLYGNEDESDDDDNN